MALPKIDTPTFELKVPSSGKRFTFRPWLVKEEKVLMLANEGGQFEDMVQACKTVVQNCSFGKVDAGKITMFDLQHLFIRCKEKSVTGTQQFTLICGNCEHKIPYELKLEDLDIVGEMKTGRLDLDGGIVLQLKYPTVNDTVNGSGDMFDYIKACLASVTVGEETITVEDETPEEIEQFIDSLPVAAYNEMLEYFDSMPMMSHEVNYKCPECDTDNTININGAEHFFA